MARFLVIFLVAANVLYFGWSRFAAEEKPVLTAVATDTGRKNAPAGPPPCATLGPFNDELLAEQAEKQLTRAGWRMQRRASSEDVNDGWWVYVTSTSAAAQARMLEAIRRAGLRDAFSMPDDPEFRVSVGLFSEESRAEDRAQRVQRLRLDAVVKERRKQQPVIWFDMPGVARETLADGRLAPTGLPLDVLRIESCPLAAPADSTVPGTAPKTDDSSATDKADGTDAARKTGLAGTIRSGEAPDARV